MKKKLLTLMTMLVTMFQLSITAFTAPVADVKQGMESKVFVSGSLGEKYAGKSVTMLVVADGADLKTLTKDELYYISEIKADETGYYELLFGLDETHGAYDIYVNEARETLEECTVNDYSESAYIDADINVAREDGILNLVYKIRNVFGYDEMNYDLITAYYLDGKLVNVSVDSADLSENTEVLEDSKKIAVPDETEANRIKFFVFKKDTLEPVTDSTMVYNHYGPEFEYVTLAEETTINLAEDTKDSTYENYVKYSGRWAKNSDGYMQGYWTRPYVEIRCDSDLLKAEIAGNWDLYVNGEMVYRQYPGMSAGFNTYDFSKYLADGISEVMIIGTSETGGIIIKDVTLGANSRLYVTREKDLNMLFVGDSIYSASYGYARRVPLALEADFTTISRSGSSLSDNYGVLLFPYNPSGLYIKGAYSQFDCLETFQVTKTTDAANGTYTLKEGAGGATPYNHGSEDNYSDDDFDVVVCGYGHNDMLYDGEKVVNAFKEDYAKFIEKFHTYYPNAKIVVMQTLNSNPVNAAEAAKFATRDAVFTAMNEEGYFDADYVYYMPTDDIELKYYDNLHPNEEDPDGHPKLTEYVIDFLKDNKIIK